MSNHDNVPNSHFDQSPAGNAADYDDSRRGWRELGLRWALVLGIVAIVLLLLTIGEPSRFEFSPW